MRYLAVLGRQPLISAAELESLFQDVRLVAPELAEFSADREPEIRRLGGTQKIAQKIDGSVMDFLRGLPESGKITLGVSDFSRGATAFKAQGEALKLKRMLAKMGRSARVVPNKEAALSSATSFHNKLFDKTKIELIKHGKDFYRVIGVQDIDAYVKRDQARPARDAKVGMLPPKLAQILINLCGDLPKGSVLLDPFCGTGVVLQEAALMGYTPYGTDVNERMVEYTKRNLEWLLSAEGPDALFVSRGCASAHLKNRTRRSPSSQATALNKNTSGPSVAITSAQGDAGDSQKEQSASLPISFLVTQGDAMSFQWERPVNAVACEVYLGRPMSLPPAEIKLKQEKQECGGIILKFLKNLAGQIEADTPVAIAVPAWLRPDGSYERLNLLDEIENLSYNVKSFRNLGQRDLLYHRDKQVVAREIIVLRKK